jgi:hypothetical protein
MHQHITKQHLHFGKLQAGIVLLVLITAGLHGSLAAQPDEELRIWFLWISQSFMMPIQETVQ